MATAALSQFSTLQSASSLSILDLSKSISENEQDATSSTTPATLAADLVHYKELFSKLRFTYHEQVTKEKFLRAITADPPLFVDAADNASLEMQLATEKAALKAQKAEIVDLTEALEARGRALVRRYQALRSQHSTLELLPSQIAELEAAVAELREEYPLPDPSVPSHLTLSASETRTLLEAQQRDNEQLDEQIALLRDQQIPAVDRDLERLEDDLAQLTAAKKVAVARAREARERKEGGGVDEVERHGRWCRAGEAVMREIVG